MEKVRILEIKESVFADNDRQADQLRTRLKEKGVFLMNLMSSPGSGKTTTLKRTIEALKNDLRIGVMEADIDSDVDALAIAETGAKACCIWIPLIRARIFQFISIHRVEVYMPD